MMKIWGGYVLTKPALGICGTSCDQLTMKIWRRMLFTEKYIMVKVNFLQSPYDENYGKDMF